MNDIAIAVAVHVLAIVWWIGGVAMVTTVLLPTARKMDDASEGLAMFQRAETRFAWHARVATLLAAASGFYMVAVLRLWPYFSMPEYWWPDAMVFVWAIFTSVLLWPNRCSFTTGSNSRARRRLRVRSPCSSACTGSPWA